MKDLKKCPFCGCDQIQVSERRSSVVPHARYCRNCLAEGPYEADIDKAIESWNRRTSIPISAIEALRNKYSRKYGDQLSSRFVQDDLQTLIDIEVNK